jgi:hypothetical protein
MSSPFQSKTSKYRKTAAEKYNRASHRTAAPGDDEQNGRPPGGFQPFNQFGQPRQPNTGPQTPTPPQAPTQQTVQEQRDQQPDNGFTPTGPTTPGQRPQNPPMPDPNRRRQTLRPSIRDGDLNMPMINVIDAQDWTAIVKVAELPPYLQSWPPEKINPILQKFAYFLATELRGRVVRAIMTQRFRRRFRPLSEEWRKKKGNALFWINTRHLVRNINVWQQGGRWFVGFHSSQRHPESGTPLPIIVRALEFGTRDGRIPARPVFMPEATAMQRDIRKILTTWLLRQGTAIGPQAPPPQPIPAQPPNPNQGQ